MTPAGAANTQELVITLGKRVADKHGIQATHEQWCEAHRVVREHEERCEWPSINLGSSLKLPTYEGGRALADLIILNAALDRRVSELVLGRWRNKVLESARQVLEEYLEEDDQMRDYAGFDHFADGDDTRGLGGSYGHGSWWWKARG